MPISPLDRRNVLLAGAGLLLAGCSRGAAQADLTVYKDPSCGCCRAWVDHMTRAGFTAKVVETADLAPIRTRYGVPDRLAACHTALVGARVHPSGYVLEGHVPPDDVSRLLHEKPAAIGLAVPGMPLGSPGMETPGGTRQPYQVMLFGPTEMRVFASHG